MTRAKQNERYRERLLVLMKRIHAQLDELRGEVLGIHGAEGDAPEMPAHRDEAAIHCFEEELVSKLLGNEERIYLDCQAALRRLEEGTYERCEDCGLMISKARLEALPYTRCCTACERKRETTR